MLARCAVVTFLEFAPLYRIRELRRNKSVLPRERGVYGLFFDLAPGIAPAKGCLTRDGLTLLYVGTAGADLTKGGNLRNRLGDHHLGGNERRSTVCQTLAALMPELAGPCVQKLERGNLKFHTSRDGAARIRNWMDEHVSVCWALDPQPGKTEKELIAQLLLPLNLDHNSHHPFALELGRLRETRRATA
ncbi:GIY-YIG nuclease family protein [Sphingomonas xanthus]|uniref:GIY-YIG nuclease family protein n=1 Tax=Sphingomonas xanthus TaxID=2594473 RepID=UPI003CCC817E